MTRTSSRPRRKFSSQFWTEAGQLVIQSDRSIAQVASELEMNAVTLGNWVNTYRKENPKPEQKMTLADYGRLAGLEEQTRSLRMENEFLKKPLRGSSVFRVRSGVFSSAW